MSAAGNAKRKFVDALRIYVRAGRGGNGLPKYTGIGGNGGDVYITGKEGQTLTKIKKSFKTNLKAGNGETSKKFRLYGRRGEDLIIPAPLGTVVKSEVGQTLGDITSEDDKILAALGGPGGNPDNQFSGQKGQNHHIELILKLIADVGLVGFPNAGKSTLLRAISRARPKVANYPFTTLHPMIGLLEYDDYRQISVADLPGLIEGAWCNMGMGHRFLRHIERTKLLLFVVDIQGFQLSSGEPFRSPIENVILLNKELELYRAELVEKPSMLLVNKVDVPGGPEKFHEFEQQLQAIEEFAQTLPESLRPQRFMNFSEVLSCSAKFKRDSVALVRERIRKVMDLHYELNTDDTMMALRDSLQEQLYDKHIKLK